MHTDSFGKTRKKVTENSKTEILCVVAYVHGLLIQLYLTHTINWNNTQMVKAFLATF